MQLICELDPFQWFNDHACSRVKAYSMQNYNAQKPDLMHLCRYYIGGSTGN